MNEQEVSKEESPREDAAPRGEEAALLENAAQGEEAAQIEEAAPEDGGAESTSQEEIVSWETLPEEPIPSRYDFTNNYFSHNTPLYRKFLMHLKDKPCRVLEIGSYEGGSTTWLLDNVLTHPNAFVDTIDVSEQAKLIPNLRATGQLNKVKFHCGRSIDILRTLPYNSYDFVIIDGCHWTMNVLEDMVHAYRLLKIGGLMESDDYLWDDPEWNQEGAPKPGIDAFLSIYQGKVSVIYKDWRLWIEKTADPIWDM